MIDKYENSYKYIEEFFNIYPLHQLDKEHLANIKELIGEVKTAYKYNELLRKEKETVKNKNCLLTEENINLRQHLNTEEERNIMLETENKKLKVLYGVLKKFIADDQVFIELDSNQFLIDGNIVISSQEEEILEKLIEEVLNG